MMSKSNQERLDAIAERYDSERDFDYHLIRFGYERIRHQLRGGVVLEMGCASGVMTRALAKDVDHLEVVEGAKTYLDRLAAMPDLAHVVFHHVFFSEFHPRERFTDVIMARALEHLADPVRTLSAVRGWLRDGGRLHIVVPNADSLHRRLGVAMGLLSATTDLSERDHRYGHQRVYDRALLEQHVTEAGFEVVHREGVFLKPLSNAQMETWEQAVLDGLNVVGRSLPDWCAEIYVVAQPA